MTITTYAITFLAGVGMGTVKKCEHKWDPGLFEQAIPASTAANKILLDIFGWSHTIHIEGRYTVSDGAVATFIAAFDVLQGIGTQAKQTFSDVKANTTYDGLVTGCSRSDEEGGVNFVDYTIDFTQGTV